MTLTAQATGFNPVDIRDEGLIQAFLEALQIAYTTIYEYKMDIEDQKPDQFTLHFKEPLQRKPISFQLCTSSRNMSDCFGPGFHDVLCLLGKHQTVKLREMVAEKGAQIQAITIDDKDVTDTKPLDVVIEALKQVDERAFAYTEGDYNSWSRMEILFKDDSSEVVILSVPIWYRSSRSVNENDLPLPDNLFYCCPRIRGVFEFAKRSRTKDVTDR